MAALLLQIFLLCSSAAVARATEETAATCDSTGNAECSRQHALRQDVGEGGEGTSWLSMKAFGVQREQKGSEGQRDHKDNQQDEHQVEDYNCMTEPEDFKTEWDRLPYIPRDPRCVCSSLWGSIFNCADSKLYGDKAEKAWIFGKADLEQLLWIQKNYGRTGAKVSSAAFVLVGFGPPALDDPLDGLCLAVFKLPPPAIAVSHGTLPQIPTWTWWFYTLSLYLFNIPYETQRLITVAYSRTGPATNVLDVFQTVTGCDKDSIQAGGFDDCNPSALRVKDALAPYQQQGLKCVKVFFDMPGNRWTLDDPAAVRMMLWQCYDVNPFNTGVGLGWNSYPNPLVCKPPDQQTNSDHYTGEEYVISNVPTKTLPKFLPIKLSAVTAQQNSGYTTNGYC